jgi:hypothetical protein
MVGKSLGGAGKRVTLFAMTFCSLESGYAVGSTLSHDDDPCSCKARRHSIVVL